MIRRGRTAARRAVAGRRRRLARARAWLRAAAGADAAARTVGRGRPGEIDDRGEVAGQPTSRRSHRSMPGPALPGSVRAGHRQGFPELVGADPHRRGSRAPAADSSGRFRAEDGRELFDLPDAPRPGADVPAPPRFLPGVRQRAARPRRPYALLRRGGARNAKFFTGSGLDSGTLLVDGLLRATWKMSAEGSGAELWVRPFKPLTRSDRADIEEEGHRLLELIAADVAGHRVRISAR